MSKKGTISIASRYVDSAPIEHYYKLDTRVVGSGMSGPVTLAASLEDGRKVAVKSFKKQGMNKRKKEELKSEVEIYLTLDHPHVAHLDRVFETEEDIHLVMEFMAGGELYDRLSSQKQYTEELAANTTYQMLLAVGYLHGHNIAHRDLKLENFLYESTTSDTLKLIDFGFAKFWDIDSKMSQACGSVHYVAPEVLMHSYTPKADLWSLGIIVYMLLTGSPPFHGADDEVLRKIKVGQPTYSRRFNNLSSHAQSFVKGLLVLSPEERMDAEQALAHDWIQGKNTMARATLDMEVLKSLRGYAHASNFKRAVLSMMAWSLSQQERNELRDMFLTIDTDNKGTITHSEMKSILEENFNVNSDEVDRLFEGLDTDNDNEIAYSEFLAAALSSRVKVHQDLLHKTFLRFDVSGTGQITADDLVNMLGDDFEDQEIAGLLEEADTDKDGQINFEEFIAYFQKRVEEEDGALRRTKSTQTSDRGAMLEKVGTLLDMLEKEAPRTKHMKKKVDGQALKIGGI